MGRTRKRFILITTLMLILSFMLNTNINNYPLNKESSKLHLSDVPIGFGETISASIDLPGEVDNYTFYQHVYKTFYYISK